MWIRAQFKFPSNVISQSRGRARNSTMAETKAQQVYLSRDPKRNDAGLFFFQLYFLHSRLLFIFARSILRIHVMLK